MKKHQEKKLVFEVSTAEKPIEKFCVSDCSENVRNNQQGPPRILRKIWIFESLPVLRHFLLTEREEFFMEEFHRFFMQKHDFENLILNFDNIFGIIGRSGIRSRGRKRTEGSVLGSR